MSEDTEQEKITERDKEREGESRNLNLFCVPLKPHLDFPVILVNFPLKVSHIRH